VPSRHPERRFRDILENIEAIERYTQGLDEAAFVNSDLVVDAVERCFSRLCEAARKLEGLAEELAPDQPWKKIRDFGNILRHDYDMIERKDLWGVVSNDLPSLRAACQRALIALGDTDT
jgi:uncharacterized protein with HEPN domain